MKKVGILGAGMMGAGIAYACANSKITAILKDVDLAIAEKGITALMGFVREDGSVLNTSQSVEPLQNIEGYLHSPSIPGDPHSAGPMLMACAGPWLAREPRSMVKS